MLGVEIRVRLFGDFCRSPRLQGMQSTARHLSRCSSGAECGWWEACAAGVRVHNNVCSERNQEEKEELACTHRVCLPATVFRRPKWLSRHTKWYSSLTKIATHPQWALQLCHTVIAAYGFQVRSACVHSSSRSGFIHRLFVYKPFVHSPKRRHHKVQPWPVPAKQEVLSFNRPKMDYLKQFRLLFHQRLLLRRRQSVSFLSKAFQIVSELNRICCQSFS